jgi:CRISPR-associated protein Cmr2
MLSELSKAAARTLATRYGLESLIFPAPGSLERLAGGSDFNVPNKLVAVVSDPPAVAGNLVRSGIQARLYELRDRAFGQVRSQRQFDWVLAEAQIDDLVEIYWVGVELAAADDYVQVRNKAEALLNARKTTRDFRPFDGAPLPKSSLDGSREAVIDEQAYPSRTTQGAAREQMNQRLYSNFGARPAERLSGVDLLKRLGARDLGVRFKSTSHMAALPFLASIDRDGSAAQSANLLAAIKAMLAQEEIPVDEDDGALVFASRLAEWIPDRERLSTVRTRLEEMLERFAGQKTPPPYYTLLLADGDNMGAAIDAQQTRLAHRNLSQALSEFAGRVDQVVREHEGAPAYSGGDDVLAYLPVHTVLPCAQALAEAFAGKMEGFLTSSGVSPTLSTGIVVVHHLDPLSESLELARHAEKAAKSVPGKHGLAITVSKRSGVDRTIKGPRVALLRRLNQLIDWSREGAISAGSAYELQELGLVLEPDPSGDARAAIVHEAQRVIERKRASGGSEKQDEINSKIALWLASDATSASQLAQEMIIAGVFASAMDLAYGQRKEAGSA